MSSYGAGRTKRTRATKAQMEERYEALIRIVEAERPTSIRFAYYRATTEGLVPKDQNGYEKVQRAILHLRRAGELDYESIVDTNRWMRKPRSWDSCEDLLDEMAASYRKSLWRDAGRAVEVWCESESVAGVLYPKTAEWDVPLYPIKGQTSDTFAYSAGQHYARDRRELVIYYVGDHDPHGYEIESNLRAKLTGFSGRDDITWTRLACGAGEVSRFGLTGTPAKKASYVDAVTGRREPWHGDAIEVEALSPNWLRDTLGERIEQHTDANALRVHKLAEKSERDGLRALSGYLEGGSSLADLIGGAA